MHCSAGRVEFGVDGSWPRVDAVSKFGVCGKIHPAILKRPTNLLSLRQPCNPFCWY